MKLKLTFFSIILFLSCFSTNLFAQHKDIIGVSLTLDAEVENELRPGFGLTYERIITRRSSFSTGIFYRTSETGFSAYNGSGQYLGNAGVAGRYINIPLLYKYRQKWVNFSVGPVFDFYVGYTRKYSNNIDLANTKYNQGTDLNIGVMGKVGKDFKLTEQLLLEPEVRLYFPSFNGGVEQTLFYGAAVNMRYLIGK
ncbi:hypothetical protein V6R21_25135 [Limibacter armeniacum]|uniref:hypothetical protein n=1 Tax=Limibacter armeniacum TaxID=466084 RepID=UPI002FE60D16